MADKKDDPREVLTLLNSLGFVGITAQQLKAFMKDLKMHRKIKERERQQWKDDTKKKILLRQQELYREVLQEHKMETTSSNNRTESTISSESSTFQDDSSYKVVTVKIRCMPKDKENEPEDNGNNQTKKTSFRKTHTTSWAEEFRQNSLRYDDNNGYNTSSSSSIHESNRRSNYQNNQSQNHSAGASTDSTKYISLEKPSNRTSRSDQHLKQSNLAPPKSPARIKPSSSRHTDDKSDTLKRSQSSADLPTNPPPSRSSVQSRPKSFIRPWRLQPESHRSSTNTKSDPVALYQKYREEWKQLALPGEENHAGIRWAVREKMLGIDPNPRFDIEMIEETNNNFTSNYCNSQSILNDKEQKIYRRKSRKIRKEFTNSNPVQRISKPIFTAKKKQYTYFRSISESFLVQTTSLELHKNDKAQSPRSILTLSTPCEVHELNRTKIEHIFNAESVSYLERDFQSIIIPLRVTSAKQTLERLINKLLNKDINSYTETYKYTDKCCCVLQSKDNE